MVTFDPAKRAAALRERDLDFLDAPAVLAGLRFEFSDERFAYGERRTITVGLLRDRMVVVVWTEREGVPHVISMRKANDREQRRYRERLA